MSKLKRWFITPYFLVLTAILTEVIVQAFQGNWSWAPLTLGIVPTMVITVVHALFPHRPRTPRRYPSFVVAAVAGIAGSLWAWPDLTPPFVGVGLLVGVLLYLYWYSEFGLKKSQYLTVGQALPAFGGRDASGTRVDSASLKGSPALILFYRGNWCPVCTAQIDELARSYDALRERGIRVVLISPQPDTHSAALAKKVNLPFEFWVDDDNAAAKALGIVDPAGLPIGMEALGYGSETPVPTALLVDARGTILYSDQAENYRIRPEPSAYLEAFDRANHTILTPS